LVALAAFVRRKARERSSSISGQLPGHGVKTSSDLVVVELGEAGPAAHHDVRIDEFDASAAKADVVI
jgi:propionyl-CoA carboxylase alpha chain